MRNAIEWNHLKSLLRLHEPSKTSHQTKTLTQGETWYIAERPETKTQSKTKIGKNENPVKTEKKNTIGESSLESEVWKTLIWTES